ncbi:MAG: cytochrome P460 family protein [Alphaproteobacteria bacterium]|nr:cytochrome P460 family protein [Alphaproteobacteria bacterium]
MKTKIIAAALAMMMFAPAQAEEPRIDFPADYKSYKNYLSLDRIGDNKTQIIRLFANKVAQAGPGEKGALPDGSVLVGEIYKAEVDEDGEAKTSVLGRRIRKKLAAIAVMEKRKGWGEKFDAEHKNGDWDFAIFSPDGKRLVKKDLNSCRACHAPLTETDHVWSYEHLR